MTLTCMLMKHSAQGIFIWEQSNYSMNYWKYIIQSYYGMNYWKYNGVHLESFRVPLSFLG
jgi:hypothetical protein